MNDTNILQAIDLALGTPEDAARRKQCADRKQAALEAIRKAPSPSRESYTLIAKRLKFVLQPELASLASCYAGEWRTCYGVAMEHTHAGARNAWSDHVAEIEVAGNDPERLKGLQILTREEIQASFMEKMKSALRNSQIAMGKLNALVMPVRLDFANAIERLAFSLELADEAEARELGLEGGPSFTVLQLLKAVLDLRTTALQLDPSFEGALTISDFCAAK